jgi:hypothetical protein
MNRFLIATLVLTAFGCSKSSEPVSNIATEYTQTLQTSVEKAEDAAARANKALEEAQKQAKQAASLD